MSHFISLPFVASRYYSHALQVTAHQGFRAVLPLVAFLLFTLKCILVTELPTVYLPDPKNLDPAAPRSNTPLPVKYGVSLVLLGIIICACSTAICFFRCAPTWALLQVTLRCSKPTNRRNLQFLFGQIAKFWHFRVWPCGQFPTGRPSVHNPLARVMARGRAVYVGLSNGLIVIGKGVGQDLPHGFSNFTTGDICVSATVTA